MMKNGKAGHQHHKLMTTAEVDALIKENRLL
jgi:hypothetical protein